MNTIKSNRYINVLPTTTMSSASSLHTGTHITPVYLNLYDLGGCTNACVHSVGLSFYHCAVQAHSAEYGYMGHPYRFTGLYKTSKHDSRFHLYRLRDSIEVGWTWFSEKEIDQIVHDLKPFYFGCDYHTIHKNSIHFAKYLLQQLSNDLELKHLEPIKIIEFPSYIDRGRRFTQTFDFLQMFDTEKAIAEINILYFLYMKYEGDMKEVCQILKCDTLEKLKRCLKLIEQGIQRRKLPIFVAFTTFEMKTAYEYLYIIDQTNVDVSSINEQLTLTEIFHQFDTITLRGRTSIDRYLNIQRTQEHTQQLGSIKNDRQSIPLDYQQRSGRFQGIDRTEVDVVSEDHQHNIKQNQGTHKYRTSSIKHDGELLSNIHRSSFPQNRSQNQDRTPLTSRSASSISGLAIRSTPLLEYEHLHMRTAIPIGTVLRLQDTPNPNLPLTELHLTTNDDHHSFSMTTHRQQKHSHTSRRRKLPRDLEPTNDLYTITNQNSFRYNHTNNARSTISSFSHCSQPVLDTISFHTIQTNEDIDSNA